MIQVLLDLNRNFISPMVEISADGRLCIASTSKLIIEKRKHSLAKPDEFYKEIAGHTELKRVQKLLEAIHELMRLSDNNFVSNPKESVNLNPLTQIQNSENNAHAGL